MPVFIDTDSSAYLARESAFSPDRDRCQRNSRDGGEFTPWKGGEESEVGGRDGVVTRTLIITKGILKT